MQANERIGRFGALEKVVLYALVVKLWLTSETRIISVYGPHDMLNYIEHAKFLSMGQWFGPYNQLTLIKMPMFAIFLATIQEFGIPVTLALTVLYATACYIACVAIRPIIHNPRILSLIFLVTYFQPLSSGSESWILSRGPFNTALACLVASSALAVFIRAKDSFDRLIRWMCLLGASLTAFYLTREEAIWIFPLVVLMLSAYALRVYRWSLTEFKSRIALLLIPVVIGVSAISGIVLANKFVYGWATLVELQTPEYLSAYNSMIRIEVEGADRHVAAPREARNIAYAVSPAANELRPFLEGAIGAAWSANACDGRTSCPAGFLAGWFMWALRDAAAAAGHYKSGQDARGYYAAIGNQIDEACSAKKIRCRPKGNTLLAPLSINDVPVVFNSLVTGVRIVLSYEQRSAMPNHAAGSSSVLRDYNFIAGMADTGNSGYDYAGWFIHGLARKIEIVDRNNKVVSDATLRFSDSTDVRAAFQAKPEFKDDELQNVRFEIQTSCTDCFLSLTQFDGKSHRIPLQANVRDVEAPGEKYHLDKVEPLLVEAADAPVKRILLSQIGDIYAFAVPALALLTGALVLLRLPRIGISGVKRIEHVLFCIGFSASAGVLLIGLSLINSFSFGAFHGPEYLSPLYALLPFTIAFVLSVELHNLNRVFGSTGFMRSRLVSKVLD